MTYPIARMVIWNPAAYDSKRVRQAAVFILGAIFATQEDIQQAASLFC